MANYFLIPPKKQKYYQVLCYVMSILGFNTHVWSWFKMPKNFWFHVQRHLLLIVTPIATISQIVYLYLYHNEHEFETLSMIYTIIQISLIFSLKLYIAQTQKYKKAMTNFMNKIHLYNYFSLNRNEYVKKTLITVEKYSRWSHFYYMTLCYICWVSFETVPMVHNIQNNESINNITTRLEIMIHVWMPFDYEYNFFNWLIAQLIAVYCGFLVMTAIILFDSVNMMFLYHIIGHIKILKHRIRTNFKENMSEREVEENLIAISVYYSFIKRTLTDIEGAFGLNVVGIYGHNLISGGLFMYQLMSAGAETATILTYGLMIPIYMGELIVLSLVLEDIRIKADDIPDMIYALKWEKMSLANQKLVLMILFQVQSPLEFTAAFNVKTGVQPAMSIIKTTFSYYVMIKSQM